MDANESRPAKYDPMLIVDADLRFAFMDRLIDQWRTLATELAPYSEAASRAYSKAADDLEAELRGHPTRMEALIGFREAVLSAVRSLALVPRAW